MATLTANVQRFYENSPQIFNTLPMATDIVYQGAAVGDNGSGYAEPLRTTGTAFRGFALEKVDNAAGATKYIQVASEGFIKLAVTSAAITDVGRPVYASDDNTFALAGVGTKIGYVHRYVSSGVAIVKFGGEAAVEKIHRFCYNIPLATIADGDLITGLTPGFNGRVIGMEATSVVVTSTAAKLSTLNVEIGTTNVTGGTLALTTAAFDALGETLKSAAVTALAGFVATDTLSVEASSTTAFIEGEIALAIILGQ